jgi:predicted nucleotide-binding protein (sugar kinase/HSP70/actin superfamily)
VSKKYVYLTAGSCGACRFGQYHQSYELALRNSGLDAFRMFLMAQDQMDQKAAMGDGIDLNLPMTPRLSLGHLLHRPRAGPRVPGAALRGRARADERRGQGKRRAALRGLSAAAAPRAVRVRGLASDDLVLHAGHAAIHGKFSSIEVDRLRVKPKVKITGEFYLQTVEGDPNYNIHRWLEAEGAQVYPAGVAVWMDYLLRLGLQRFEDYSGIERTARLKLGAGRAVQWIYRRAYDGLRHALGDLTHELPQQLELRRLAAPYFHSRLDGGEGDMLVGKAIWAHQRKKAHMICELSPYSCMPNTMSIGAMAGVLGKHPDILYAPARDQGRRRGARAVALPDDPDRGQEARPAGDSTTSWPAPA